MTKKTPRSPQEKKSLSYSRDRRNAFGENDKASRKAIPARKAGENRKSRRKAGQALDVALLSPEEEAGAIESSLNHDIERVGGWTKDPDINLKDHIQRKARRRSWRGLPPNRKPDPTGKS